MGHCIPVNFIVPYELFQKILSDYPKANEINQFRLGFRSFLFIIIHNFVVVFFLMFYYKSKMFSICIYGKAECWMCCGRYTYMPYTFF